GGARAGVDADPVARAPHPEGPDQAPRLRAPHAERARRRGSRGAVHAPRRAPEIDPAPDRGRAPLSVEREDQGSEGAEGGAEGGEGGEGRLDGRLAARGSAA